MDSRRIEQERTTPPRQLRRKLAAAILAVPATLGACNGNSVLTDCGGTVAVEDGHRNKTVNVSAGEGRTVGVAVFAEEGGIDLVVVAGSEKTHSFQKYMFEEESDISIEENGRQMHLDVDGYELKVTCDTKPQ